jgi:hypothetical protein
MDETRRVTTCAGIDVFKDRLDVHVLPTGEDLEQVSEAKRGRASSPASGGLL